MFKSEELQAFCCEQSKLKKIISSAIHWSAALILLVYSILAIQTNQTGQNIINFTACAALIVRLDNIIIFYRIYLNDSFIENPATAALIFVFAFGKLIEKFHPTNPNNNTILNGFTYYFILVIISINVLYYVIIFLSIVIYMGRQIYKLMVGALLSSSATLLEEELRTIKSSGKKFGELIQEAVDINHQCSICLLDFEYDEKCIMLPCRHCFHEMCIEGWLDKGKSTCPFCRNNIRLGIMRNM